MNRSEGKKVNFLWGETRGTQEQRAHSERRDAASGETKLGQLSEGGYNIMGINWNAGNIAVNLD